MLLQGQNDAVGDDGGQDHVLKWSIKVKERLNFKIHLFHFHHVTCGIVFVDIKLTFDAFSKAETLYHILLEQRPIDVAMILPDG